DINSLTGQLVGYALYPRTTHAHTGTDRIDALVLGLHRDLGAQTGVTGPTAQLDQPLADFRHFQPEQFDQKLWLGAGHEQLRSPLFGTHLIQVTPHAIARTHRFARDHLITRDDGLGITTEIEDNRAALHALDQPG